MANASETNDLVIHGEAGEIVALPDDLGHAIAANNREIKKMQLEVTRRELEVQRAVEEQKLLQELQTLDEMTLHKIERADPKRKNRMQISAESLARVIELQDAIKLASQEQKQLEDEGKRIIDDAQRVEDAIATVDHQLTSTIENTGFDGKGGRPFEALDNVYRRHQLELATLEAEQKTIKMTLGKLTSQIEDLTGKLEEVKDIDHQLAEAEAQYQSFKTTYDGSKDSLASLKRILAKKEKMLNDIDRKDMVKELKKLEGDKRVLHSDLSKQVELLRINDRAIFANDDRLRKLEARLLELEKVLPGLFAEVDEAGLSIGKPTEVPDTDTVGVDLFTDAVNDLQLQRDTLANRDERLEELDAQIEALERKVDIVHAAQESQTAKAANDLAEIDRERGRLENHVDQISKEFEAEKQRLTSERKRWEEVARKPHQ